jgi:cobalt-zinc-cadmium efflux system outer membrane protein
MPAPKKDDLLKLALSLRPDLKALLLEREKAEMQRRLARAEAIPNLTVGLFAQWQRNSLELGALSSINSDKLVGLRLSMPVPLFDHNSGGKAAATAQREAADSRYLALERAITAEVHSAISRLVSSEQILSLFEKGIIPQLTENLKLTEEAYRVGEVGILAVIDEQKKFFELNDAWLAALHARRVALNKLETAVAINLGGGVQ